jgi:hypothetical protein
MAELTPSAYRYAVLGVTFANSDGPVAEQTFLMVMRSRVDIPGHLDDQEPVRISHGY